VLGVGNGSGGVVLKILNLYAGIGGNRKLWDDEHEITAVELNSEIAAVYQDFFPNDKMIIADAHEYLLNNFAKFDFIWSSPPCQSHSQIRFNIGYKANRKYRRVDAVYPEMSLYQEIILLANYYTGWYVVENTVPYYKPLIDGMKSAGHIWWSNFIIMPFKTANRNHRGGTVESLQDRKGFDLSNYPIHNKRQILRNCVEPETGQHVLNCMMAPQTQTKLFEEN
jgi:DNA (cytosine-5)-methyltransferase 1